MLTTLFVYGTLKRGFCRERFLAGQQFLGLAQTEPVYRMFHLGTYPGLVESLESGIAIQGELWQVDADCLRRLDIEEEVDSGLYIRQTIRLTPPVPEAQAYFYLGPTAGLPDCGAVWE